MVVHLVVQILERWQLRLGEDVGLVRLGRVPRLVVLWGEEALAAHTDDGGAICSEVLLSREHLAACGSEGLGWGEGGSEG